MGFFRTLLRKLRPKVSPRRFRLVICGSSGEFLRTFTDEKFDLSATNKSARFFANDGYGNELMVRVRIYPDRIRLNYIEEDLNLARRARGMFRDYAIKPGMARSFKPRHMVFTLEEYQPAS